MRGDVMPDADGIHGDPATTDAARNQLRSADRDGADRRQHHRRRHLQPADLAGAATARSRLVSMGLTTVGALALALLFAALSRRLPADGGPYAYARVAFGNGLGFANAWSYWITAWAGNAAIAVGWVLYVEEFINKGHNRLVSIAARARRPVDPGGDQPVRREEHGIGPGGHHDREVRRARRSCRRSACSTSRAPTSRPWNVSGESAIAAIGGGMAIALFSYLGVETAAVAAAKVRDPDRNIPRATILGTLATAVVYMLSLIAVFGILPDARSLPTSTAPFSDAVNAMFGGTWAGNVMAVVGHHLRLRRAERLDDDLRRDAARRGEGRPVPRAVQAHLEQRACRPSASSPRPRWPRSR